MRDAPHLAPRSGGIKDDVGNRKFELLYDCVDQREYVYENLESLKSLNFGINFKTDTEIEILEMPLILAEKNLRELFQDMVLYFQSDKISEHSIDKFMRQMLEYKSCRGAVMFGDRLEKPEISFV